MGRPCNILSSGAHGVKDPGDGAMAQHIRRLELSLTV